MAQGMFGQRVANAYLAMLYVSKILYMYIYLHVYICVYIETYA